MLIGTPRYVYQVGSDGGSSIPDVSLKLACMDAFAIRSQMLWEPESPIGIHGCFRYSIPKHGHGDEARAPEGIVAKELPISY